MCWWAATAASTRAPSCARARCSQPATILTRGTPLFDLVNGDVLRAGAETPLIVPENAVVVPGARAISKGKGQEWGLSLYAPAIVKYRDDKTDLSTTLEELLR